LGRAEQWIRCAADLKESLEKNAWDGDWYRRAYFDSGAALGSASNEECRIDSIAQSWAVLSGAGDPARSRQAMRSVEQYLVRRGDDLVLLFTPPFHVSQQDPGYVKSYLPGVRENGGQYTHAAVWTTIAFAAMGDGNQASELFSMLNPINHTGTRAGVYRYKVEPYVMAGDVYAESPHVGRGGWTWYTGSAGWTYRAGLQWILGFHLKGNNLLMDPCIPREWGKFEITYRHGSATYHLTVLNPHGNQRGVETCEVDGEMRNPPPGMLPLADDGKSHQITFTLV
jgi:cyclic beta-1,2-glucan synthetase